MKSYTYKDEYREGVVFCFCKDGNVLLEDRGKGFNNEAFFTNGSIEIIDKEKSEDYILIALYREIDEEFGGKIFCKKEIYLG